MCGALYVARVGMRCAHTHTHPTITRTSSNAPNDCFLILLHNFVPCDFRNRIASAIHGNSAIASGDNNFSNFSVPVRHKNGGGAAGRETESGRQIFDMAHFSYNERVYAHSFTPFDVAFSQRSGSALVRQRASLCRCRSIRAWWDRRTLEA